MYFNTLFMFFYPITKDVKTNRIDNLTILLYELTVNIENKLNLILKFTELKQIVELMKAKT